MLNTLIIILGLAVVIGWTVFFVKGYKDTKDAGLIKTDYEEDGENE